MSFLGIDLSTSSKRGSYFAVLDTDGALLHLDNFKKSDELVDVLQAHGPGLIAIDAPLSLPLGMDCLEEECPCAPALDQKGRTCEQELARIRIGCFFTTKRSIIKGLIYRGLELSRDLEAKGYPVIEVYPYATKVLLFGEKIPPKNTVRGLAFLKEKLSGVVPGLGPYEAGLNHHGCDAVLSAYTAWLHRKDRTDSLGTQEEGYIVVPQVHARVLT